MGYVIWLRGIGKANFLPHFPIKKNAVDGSRGLPAEPRIYAFITRIREAGQRLVESLLGEHFGQEQESGVEGRLEVQLQSGPQRMVTAIRRQN